MSALVPTVVPCVRTEIRSQNASNGSPSRSAATRIASSMPAAKLPGVEAALVAVMPPLRSRTTQSVKVPPMSTPTRYGPNASSLPLRSFLCGRPPPGCSARQLVEQVVEVLVTHVVDHELPAALLSRPDLDAGAELLGNLLLEPLDVAARARFRARRLRVRVQDVVDELLGLAHRVALRRDLLRRRDLPLAVEREQGPGVTHFELAVEHQRLHRLR